MTKQYLITRSRELEVKVETLRAEKKYLEIEPLQKELADLRAEWHKNAAEWVYGK